MKAMALRVFALMAGAAWSSAPGKPPAFTGYYDMGGTESAGGLYVLPDQRFCLGFTAGAMDIQISGTWQATVMGGKISRLVLTPVSRLPSRYAVFTSDKDEVSGRPKPAARRLTLNGAAFSMMQDDAVLGWSEQSEPPANMAPLFAQDQYSFSRVYHLDLPANARYVFLGHPLDNGRYQLERFDTGSKRYIWVNYGERAGQNEPLEAFYIEKEGLMLSGSMLGKPDEISEAARDEIEQYCFAQAAEDDPMPYLAPDVINVELKRLPTAKPWFADEQDEEE